MLLSRIRGAARTALAARLPARLGAAPSSPRCLCSVQHADAPTASADEAPAVRGGAIRDAFLPFESPVYARFINLMMYEGKKQTARKLLWNTFTRLREMGHDPQVRTARRPLSLSTSPPPRAFCPQVLRPDLAHDPTLPPPARPTPATPVATPPTRLGRASLAGRLL